MFWQFEYRWNIITSIYWPNWISHRKYIESTWFQKLSAFMELSISIFSHILSCTLNKETKIHLLLSNFWQWNATASFLFLNHGSTKPTFPSTNHYQEYEHKHSWKSRNTDVKQVSWHIKLMRASRGLCYQKLLEVGWY